MPTFGQDKEFESEVEDEDEWAHQPEDEEYGEEEYGEEGEDEELDAFRLHPTVLPWLQTKLKAPHIGPVALYLLTHQSSQIYDLVEPINQMSGLNQERLLADVRTFMQAERAGGRQSSGGYGAGAAVSTGDGMAGGRAMKLPPSRHESDEIENLLTPQEQEAAKAVGLYLSALLTHLPAVKQWRKQVLQGKALTAAQVDVFIASPATRFLSIQDWQQHVLASRDWQERILSASEPAARVVAWEPEYVEPQEVPTRRQSPDVAAFISPGRPYYNAYRVTLELQPSGQETQGETQRETSKTTDTITTHTKTTHTTRLVRELLGTEKDLLWIPFLPLLEVADPQDETYPRIFRGSVADELRRLGEGLARGLPFEPWQVALFILTGEAPPLQPVHVTTLTPSLKAAQEAGVTPEHAFRSRLAAGSPVGGFLRIEALPWISAETIQRYYRFYQKPLITRLALAEGGERKSEGNPGEENPLDGNPPPLPRLQRLPGLSSLQAIQDMARAAQEGQSLTWSALHSRQPVRNGETGENAGNLRKVGDLRKDYSSFVKGCKTAWTSLYLPWNLKHMITQTNPDNTD